MTDETIRTTASRVIEDASAPASLRELALEALHWRLRDRFRPTEQEKAPELDQAPARTGRDC